jgi:hypothetical protein
MPRAARLELQLLGAFVQTGSEQWFFCNHILEGCDYLPCLAKAIGCGRGKDKMWLGSRVQGTKGPCKFFCGRRLPKTESEGKHSRGCQITLYEYKKSNLRSDVYNYWGLYTCGIRIGTQLVLRRHNDVIVMS